MKLKKLGNSELLVSEIGFGCWLFANDLQWGPIDESEAIQTVHAAIDAGVNFFDTAEGYGAGHSEEVLGRALKGKRRQVFISTKVGGEHHTRETLPAALDASLRRLQTDVIDLYSIHWPNRNVAFEKTMAALRHARALGKIRYIGVSNFGVGDLTDVVQLGKIVADQVPYNLFWRMLEAGIIDKCVAENIGIVAYSPLAQGLLSGKFKSAADVPRSNRSGTRLYQPEALQLAFAALGRMEPICKQLGVSMSQLTLAWSLRQRGISTVIPGARNRRQLEQNVGAAAVALSDEIVETLRAISQPLYDTLGTDPDMWGGKRYR